MVKILKITVRKKLVVYATNFSLLRVSYLFNGNSVAI